MKSCIGDDVIGEPSMSSNADFEEPGDNREAIITVNSVSVVPTAVR